MFVIGDPFRRNKGFVHFRLGLNRIVTGFQQALPLGRYASVQNGLGTQLTRGVMNPKKNYLRGSQFFKPAPPPLRFRAKKFRVCVERVSCVVRPVDWNITDE